MLIGNSGGLPLCYFFDLLTLRGITLPVTRYSYLLFALLASAGVLSFFFILSYFVNITEQLFSASVV